MSTKVPRKMTKEAVSIKPKNFWMRLVLSLDFFIFRWYMGFCHRTESDLFFSVLLPNLTYTQLREVSIEHLQRAWHANRGCLLLQSPCPVSLGLARIVILRPTSPKHVLSPDFYFCTSFGTCFFSAFIHIDAFSLESMQIPNHRLDCGYMNIQVYNYRERVHIEGLKYLIN